jgi:hypothetical protein
MRMSFNAALALATAIGLALAASPGEAKPAAKGKGRQTMEQCVGRVLQDVAKARGSETQVGPTIVARCDVQLRDTLAEAIRRGEAGSCTVESCLSMARERASAEATAAYRQMITR